ncbi:hypothetical protein DC498_07510 [Terrimonas sp.]|uniref:transposase n=1 Tax=Terrimonas sp. TaxID=1914338 RepID=UPI000D50EF2E|nr:transposase [Terrimonas sp.]PVD52769.1 hypothetical protein DC498_07510 [Terrimonas sp.]
MNKHHHRRSIRLKGYDYSKAGLYFITICCQHKICRFGEIINKKMVLNEFGQIAYNEWIKLPERFPNFELDVFQIMPNHMHGIIALVGAPLAGAPDKNTDVCTNVPINDDGNDTVVGAGASPAPTTVGNIIGAYKSLAANGCLDIDKSKNETMGKLWQRNYYEHIIRDEKSYQNISNYIINNPAKWAEDKFYANYNKPYKKS